MPEGLGGDVDLALRRAASARNRHSRERFRVAVASGHDRRWAAVLVAQPVILAAVALVCVAHPSERVVVSLAVVGLALVVVGSVVAFAVRTTPVHDHPLGPLDRTAGKDVVRMVAGRAPVPSELRPIVDAVAAIHYRQRVLVAPWSGMALLQLGQVVAGDGTLGRWLAATAAVLSTAAALIFLHQAVRSARVARRRPT